MARYAVQLRQAQGGGDWPLIIKYSNVYFVEAATAAAAAEQGRQIWLHLRQAMRVFAFCYQVYATDLVEATTNYYILAITAGEQRGTVGSTSRDNAYNPNAVQRVDLLIGSSRPSRKFHRSAFFESDVADGGLSLVSGFNTAYVTAYTAIEADEDLDIVDIDGQAWIGTSVLGVTIKKLGKLARNDVPTGPAFG